MSFVTLVEIKDGNIRMMSMHYRDVLSYLRSGGRLEFSSVPLDGGYVFADYDNKILVSAQSCFRLPALDLEWYVIEK